MQTFAKLALAAGACALGLGAVLPVQAADMGYPEAQAQVTRRRRPAITRRRRRSRATIHRLRRPPRMAIRRRRPSNTAPTSRRLTSSRRDRITAGPYWRGYGPRYAYGYGHWRGYRRW